MRCRWSCPAVALLLFVLGLAPAAAFGQLSSNRASYDIRGSYGATGSGVGVNGGDSQEFTHNGQSEQAGPASIATDFTFDAIGPKSSSHVTVRPTAMARTGHLGVGYSGNVAGGTTDTFNGGFGRITQSSVRAQWKDRLHLAGVQPGRQRTLTATVQLSGEMSTVVSATPYFSNQTSTSWAYAETVLNIYAVGNNTQNIIPVPPYGGPMWAYSGSNSQPDTSPPTMHLLAPQSVTVIMTMTEGSDYSIDFLMELTGRAFATGQQPHIPSTLTGLASWTADYTHTLSWGGITSVVDTLTGEPVTDYTLTAASGADYTQPIPEPATLALLAVAVAALARSRRREDSRGSK